MLPRILLLGKDGDPALKTLCGWLVRTHHVIVATRPTMWPTSGYEGIVSYRWHWRIPEAALVPHAINFHPAPITHRGVGGPDWAIKEGWATFGVTAHYMTPEIDAGPIIDTRTFNIWPSDTVVTLNQRAHAHLLALASDVLGWISEGYWPRPDDFLKWSGPLHTRKQLDALCAS